jgi:hypothetical protein
VEAKIPAGFELVRMQEKIEFEAKAVSDLKEAQAACASKD